MEFAAYRSGGPERCLRVSVTRTGGRKRTQLRGPLHLLHCSGACARSVRPAGLSSRRQAPGPPRWTAARTVRQAPEMSCVLRSLLLLLAVASSDPRPAAAPVPAATPSPAAPATPSVKT